MTQYWVAIHHPDDYVPCTEDGAMSHDIDRLNDVKGQRFCLSPFSYRWNAPRHAS
jgi:hypothetical protein